MDFNKLAADRYSCKNYSDKKVDDNTLNKILEAGRMAPTAKNLQEQHIYVMKSESALKMIDEVTKCRYGAPVCLVVAFDTENVYTYPGGKRQSGIEDASIVATHLMLAAASAGVDSCWVNCFDPDILAQKMSLPANEEILMILDLGYCAEGDGPRENHFKRKPLSETVTEL